MVDAANVIGTRPDGWWRDRAGAADRLLGAIGAALDGHRLERPVTVVLEGRAARCRAAPADIEVVRAQGSGDDAIVSVVSEGVAHGQRVTVVTADRGLQERVRRLGADIESPRRFLNMLPPVSPDR